MPHPHLYTLQERLAKKNDNEKVTILIVDNDIDHLKVTDRST